MSGSDFTRLGRVSRRMEQLMAERNWDEMSLHELQLLRGMIDFTKDPEGFWGAFKARERKIKEKQMEEKPFQFNILEYVEQTKKPEITEVFLREFYQLSQEDQSKVVDIMGRYHRTSMLVRGGEDCSSQEYLRIKRIDAFVEQWIEEQTKGWVSTEVEVAKNNARLDRVKASREG